VTEGEVVIATIIKIVISFPPTARPSARQEGQRGKIKIKITITITRETCPVTDASPTGGAKLQISCFAPA
jgi:hypothetical protein